MYSANALFFNNAVMWCFGVYTVSYLYKVSNAL